jgi:DNA (cytosine-5)-methyltransferase 1
VTTQIPSFRYADLFAGIGGFHATLDHAGGHCVYVSEIDQAARATYQLNWIDDLPRSIKPQINTDITTATPDDGDVDVPAHDVLAAGFPCQPFSKSGLQNGMDEARGTLFWNIARILEERRPAIVMLENVRNIAGPRHRHEWDVIIRTLREIGYRVSSTPTIFSPHFLPPSLGGTPQVRDRVYILGTYIGPKAVQDELARGIEPSPVVTRGPVEGWSPADWNTEWVLDQDAAIADLERYRLTNAECEWIDTWDAFVKRYRAKHGSRIPGFPLWSDDWKPVAEHESTGAFWDMPEWKQQLVRSNANFFETNQDLIGRWRRDFPNFANFPASRRKLEWQAQDIPTLWGTVMQLRPSGIRAKAPTYVPALVAITQTSIYGPRRRRLTPHEAARLQGLPKAFHFGAQRDAASYKQVGNGVAVGAAWHVFRTHVEQNAVDLPEALVHAVLGAPLRPPTSIPLNVG